MPSIDSPAIIVARFLKQNNYNATLEAFLVEAGLPPDTGTVTSGKGDLTIEKILEEKKLFDLSVGFERFGVGGEGDRGWSLPAPSLPLVVRTLPSASNILHVSIEKIPSVSPPQLLLATTADRRLNLIVPDSSFTLLRTQTSIHDSPILSCIALGQCTISTGMSGHVVLYDHAEGKNLDERRDHTKYAVKVTACEDGTSAWVATAGWDSKIFLYRLRTPYRSLGSPMASLTLPTPPETATFIKLPDTTSQPILLLTRRDSTKLYYYSLPSLSPSSSDRTEESSPTVSEIKLLGSQNLAPDSGAWVAFSPASVSICPTDATLLAVATTSLPHMKLIIVRLLIPPLTSSPSSFSGPAATQAAQTREKLALQERESAAIVVSTSTLAPTTMYSTPQVCWRPDGTGVWVNGDDGVIRGLEARTGKAVKELRGGHEPGTKVRSLWAGIVECGDGEEGEEWVVSGGFDKRLVVWKVEKET